MANQQLNKIDLCSGIIPQIYVMPGASTNVPQSGRGDKVAVIGAFPKVSPSLEHYTSYLNAASGLNITVGTNDIYQKSESLERKEDTDYFMGAGSLRYLFHTGTGESTVSDVIVCNYSTYALIDKNDPSKGIKCDGEKNLYDVELTNDKLKNALAQLKHEKFDILLLAFAPTKEQLDAIIAWERELYTRANPVGVVFGTSDQQLDVINSQTITTQSSGSGDTKKVVSVVESVVADGFKAKTIKASDICELINGTFKNAKESNGENHTLYACIPQGYKLSFENKYLTPVESAAYYCGAIANLRVNKSMTNRTLDYIDAVNEDLVYINDSSVGNTGDRKSDGYKLVEAGVTMLQCVNRSNKTYAVVNSQQPCGFDLAHLRTTAYIVKRLQLDEYLGKVNNITNIDLINNKVSSMRSLFIGMFDILDDMDYNVERAGKNCVKIYLKMVYYGIILNEVIYLDEEVI